MNVFRVAVAITVLTIGVVVALSPSVVYAPTPKVVLYALVAMLPAVLFGAEAASRLELKLPGFIFTTTGAAAVCIGTLFLLDYLSKPEEQIAVFYIVDREGQPVRVDWSGGLEVLTTRRGLTVTKYAEGNTAVLIFPEQVGEAEMHVRKSSDGPVYSGMVTYAGSRSSTLRLDKDLQAGK